MAREAQASPEIAAIIEAERSAIAAEIHDGLLPYLYAAAAKLAAIRRSTHANFSDSALDERLADAADWIDQSREMARTLMNGITYPPQALADPLAAAQAFLTQFGNDSEVVLPKLDVPAVGVPDASGPTELTSTTGSTAARVAEVCWQWGDGPSPLANQLPPTTAIAIYRLTTECVRNALRHASASRVGISAEFFDGVATVQIQDDGCGFEVDEVDFSSSHGLALARRRAEAVGIDMQLESCDATSRHSDPSATSGTQVTLRTSSSTTGQPLEQVQPRSRPTNE